MLSNRVSKIVLGAAVASLGTSVNAGLTYDLVATASSNGTVDPGGKSVIMAGPGTVTMDLFARVTDGDADPNNQGFLLGAGSFLSTGGILGDMAATRSPQFVGTGSSAGKIQDLDGDGDLDVGSNAPGTSANFFSVRANTAPTPVFGSDILIGTVVYTFNGPLGGPTSVNFRIRSQTASGAGWFERGSQVNASTAAPALLGGAVSIAVPEPTTLSLAAIGGLAMLARRRNA